MLTETMSGSLSSSAYRRTANAIIRESRQYVTAVRATELVYHKTQYGANANERACLL